MDVVEKNSGLRRATHADLQKVAEIEAQSYQSPWPRSFFARCLDVGYEFWVIGHEDQIQAYAVMSMMGGAAHLMNLCVQGQERRKGLGRSLLFHLIQLARSHHAGLFLEVRASNEAAQNLYSQAGLKALGVRHHYYDYDEGREDALVMALPYQMK